MSDAKMPDMQAGYEKAYNHALVGNAGANLIYESAGMLASLLGFSMEGLIIDNDVIGAVQRTIKGIEVTDESLSLDTIRKVCQEGPGHYLGADQTLQLIAARVHLSLGRRSHQPQRMGGSGASHGGSSVRGANSTRFSRATTRRTSRTPWMRRSGRGCRSVSRARRCGRRQARRDRAIGPGTADGRARRPPAALLQVPESGGEVFQRRGAWRISSPTKRTDSTRRRLVTPGAPCKASM